MPLGQALMRCAYVNPSRRVVPPELADGFGRGEDSPSTVVSIHPKGGSPGCQTMTIWHGYGKQPRHFRQTRKQCRSRCCDDLEWKKPRFSIDGQQLLVYTMNRKNCFAAVPRISTRIRGTTGNPTPGRALLGIVGGSMEIMSSDVSKSFLLGNGGMRKLLSSLWPLARRERAIGNWAPRYNEGRTLWIKGGTYRPGSILGM